MLSNKEAKGEDVTYKSYSTQVNLADCASEKDFNFLLLQKQIPEETLYREYPQVEEEFFLGTVKKDDPREEYGLENVPHVTVLYGLKEEQDYFKMRDRLKNFGAFDFEIGKIKSFRNEGSPYDVIVLEIVSPRLGELHKFIKENYKNDYSFPQYIPHMTLAYVKKGALTELEGECSWTGAKYRCDLLKFSHVHKYFLDIPLG